jgi:hypothetical protein
VYYVVLNKNFQFERTAFFFQEALASTDPHKESSAIPPNRLPRARIHKDFAGSILTANA